MTLLALHQYLGLGAELIAKQHRGDREVNWATEESVNTPEEEEEADNMGPLDTEQLTPTTPSALQLQLESYQDLAAASPAR